MPRRAERAPASHWVPVSERSEHDPELAAATSTAMHPVTGAFADATHESAFAAQFFRLAFPCHAVLMALSVAGGVGVRDPVLYCLLGLGLVGRVLIHRMDDSVRSQQIGAWAWTAVVVSGCSTDAFRWMKVLPPGFGCTELFSLGFVIPLICLAVALISGSHCLGFVHKGALVGLVMVDCLSLSWCRDSDGRLALFVATPWELGACCTGFIVAHMVEMHVRHSYAEHHRLEVGRLRLEERNEQLRAEKERLTYDVQRCGRPLDDDGDRSAIRRGLQAKPSQPHLPADGTGPGETGAPAPSDAPPPSLPPGPPSSSSSDATKSSKPSMSSAAGTFTAPPPPTWSELDAQYYAEVAATSATEKGPVWAPSSRAGAPSGQLEAGRRRAPPPSWAELAYRRHYAELAAKSATKQGVPPGAQPSTAGRSAAPPLTWTEFYEALRKTKSCYAENAAREVAPFIARAEASQRRHVVVESAGVARLTSEKETCMRVQPELAASEAAVDLQRKDMAGIAGTGETEAFAALYAMKNGSWG